MERSPGSISRRRTEGRGKIKFKLDGFITQCFCVERAGTNIVQVLSSTFDERLSDGDDPLHDPVTRKWIDGPLKRPDDK